MKVIIIYKLGVVGYAYNPSSGGKLRQEDQEIMVILGYIKTWRPAWPIEDLVSRKIKTRTSCFL